MKEFFKKLLQKVIESLVGAATAKATDKIRREDPPSQ